MAVMAEALGRTVTQGVMRSEERAKMAYIVAEAESVRPPRVDEVVPGGRAWMGGRCHGG